MLVCCAVRNRNHIFFGCIISGHAIESTGEYPFILSTTNVQRVTFTRGEFSLILDYSCILYILGLLYHVAMLVLNIATSRRRDVSLNFSGTSRREIPTSRR